MLRTRRVSPFTQPVSSKKRRRVILILTSWGRRKGAALSGDTEVSVTAVMEHYKPLGVKVQLWVPSYLACFYFGSKGSHGF